MQGIHRECRCDEPLGPKGSDPIGGVKVVELGHAFTQWRVAIYITRHLINIHSNHAANQLATNLSTFIVHQPELYRGRPCWHNLLHNRSVPQRSSLDCKHCIDLILFQTTSEHLTLIHPLPQSFPQAASISPLGDTRLPVQTFNLPCTSNRLSIAPEWFMQILHIPLLCPIQPSFNFCPCGR